MVCDTLTNISVFIPGVPKPKGSTRAMRHSRTGRTITLPDCDDLYAWQSRISAAMSECDKTDGPVAVRLVFYVKRPKNHHGTGRNNGTLKPSAPKKPTTKPDLDKLIRAVLDAMTGIIYDDDSMVVKLSAEKLYAEQIPGVRVCVVGVVD